MKHLRSTDVSPVSYSYDISKDMRSIICNFVRVRAYRTLLLPSLVVLLSTCASRLEAASSLYAQFDPGAGGFGIEKFDSSGTHSLYYDTGSVYTGIAADQFGNFYGAFRQGYGGVGIEKIDAQGNHSVLQGTSMFYNAIAIDATGNLYAACMQGTGSMGIEKFDALGNHSAFDSNSEYFTSLAASVVPEPASATLLSLSAMLLAVRRKRLALAA